MADKSSNEGEISLVAPEVAWEQLQADTGAVLVDVRSDMEFLMIGHAKGAVHVPWVDAPDWTVNPNFVAGIRRVLLGRRNGGRSARAHQASSPLYLMCRSGNRSRDAAAVLAESGITDVNVIDGGFEGPLDEHHHRNTVAGWRFAGLPWEQC